MERDESSGAEVLLVVSESDVEQRLREAFRRSSVDLRITIVESASAALACVHGRGEFAGQRRPKTVLVDLECAGVDGLALLETIKGNPETSTIPVLTIAPGDDHTAVERSYHLRANAVLERPATVEDYDEFVRAFERFWLSRVQLPTTM